MSRPPSRLPLYVGVLLIAAGWAAIGLAWYQVARLDLETGQLPFVLSGGFGGLGLLGLGGAAVVMSVLQRAHWEARRASEELARSVRELSEAVGEAVRRQPAPAAEEERPARRRRRFREA